MRYRPTTNFRLQLPLLSLQSCRLADIHRLGVQGEKMRTYTHAKKIVKGSKDVRYLVIYVPTSPPSSCKRALPSAVWWWGLEAERLGREVGI
jgi:hypothetical protein